MAVARGGSGADGGAESARGVVGAIVGAGGDAAATAPDTLTHLASGLLSAGALASSPFSPFLSSDSALNRHTTSDILKLVLQLRISAKCLHLQRLIAGRLLVSIA